MSGGRWLLAEYVKGGAAQALIAQRRNQGVFFQHAGAPM
jgi:hypothetical protein